MISTLLLVGFGLLLLVVQAALATLVPMHSLAPNLVLPIAIFLGVAAEVPTARGAFSCFALGYLLDSFCGSPMGLQTFVTTASFLVARGAGMRLFPQGLAFQILFTFVMAIGFGATVLALRAIFEQPQLRVFGEDMAETSQALLGPAAVTALLSPPLFAATRRILQLGSQKRDERTITG